MLYFAIYSFSVVLTMMKLRHAFSFTDYALEIEFLTTSRLKKLRQDGNKSKHQMKTFYKATRRFFEGAF